MKPIREHESFRPAGRRYWYFLFFWPVYLLRYALIERWVPAGGYMLIHCPLDDRIPFCEWFLIPYVLWYFALVGIHLYTFCHNAESFRRYSFFLILATTLSTAVFLIFPSCQNLRPVTFPRDNLLSRLVGFLYSIDTNTNVFPSEHVIGAVGIYLCAADTPGLNSKFQRLAVGIFSVTVCLATVFLKQHSVLDVLGAMPICYAAKIAVYGKGGRFFGKTL